jgi:hypothetical protein
LSKDLPRLSDLHNFSHHHLNTSWAKKSWWSYACWRIKQVEVGYERWDGFLVKESDMGAKKKNIK